MGMIKTILLAEDSRQDVELILAGLEEVGVSNHVDVVKDGEEALDYLFRRGKHASRQNGNPVLVLLDIKMPKVDGLEVLKQIRQSPELKSVPAVILTSSREDTDIVKSYELGVNAYIVKPVDFDKFAKTVKKIGVFWALLNEPPPGSVRME